MVFLRWTVRPTLPSELPGCVPLKLKAWNTQDVKCHWWYLEALSHWDWKNKQSRLKIGDKYLGCRPLKQSLKDCLKIFTHNYPNSFRKIRIS